MRSPARWIALVLVVWLIVVVYMFGSVYQSSSDDGSATHERIRRALGELDTLRRQNEELRSLIYEIRNSRHRLGGLEERIEDAMGQTLNEARDNLASRIDRTKTELHGIAAEKGFAPPPDSSDVETRAFVPSKAYEQRRRRIHNGVLELWFYVSNELQRLRQAVPGDATAASDIDAIASSGALQKNIILHNIEEFSCMDGLGEWRKKEADDLAELVQKRLHRLQNPTNCADAKKLVCNVNKGCGYGCQVHHLTYCLMIAYGSQRTLILNSKGWRYSHEGWEKVFLPISDTCTSTMGGSSGHWTDEAGMKNLQIVDLPIIDSIKPRPAYLPLAIPDDLADRLMRLHGNPAVWWTGQLVRFLTRPQSELQRDIDQVREKLGFLSPIVGVHIRRTDKVGTEAALHTVQEYMYHVEDYYQKLELRWPVKVKRVYIATDEPRVLSEARKLYPGYTFLGDESVARTASLGQRYSDASLRGIILDIHFLSQSDYLVCTFSSQVCRLAYEMLNTIHPDASAWFRSLDDIYYFGGQHAHNQRALYKHEKSSVQEIDINVGDVVGIAGNHWDGFSKGLNRNTGQQGLYPSFKVEDIVDIVKMPTYDDDDGGGGGGDGRGE